MYWIRNISNQEIALNDLRIALKRGQEIDLDMICSRYFAEQSFSLKHFIKKSMLKIVSKDEPNLSKKIVHNERSASNDEIMKELREQEKRIIERQDALIKKHLGDANKSGIDPKTMENLQTAIAAMQAIAQSGGSTAAPKSQNVTEAVEDGTAVEIQKRTLNRLSRGTQGNIKQNETKSTSNVDSNIDELGDLLK